ncbi:MAG: 3-oxoacyl-ACP reductase FabG [Bacteroidetes bacterium]|nr:3-oxoacyl-ACP reductase FabG [Bacteroidota bacterium]
MRLISKVAIVTGAAESIGKAIAIRFALEGASVVVNYHTKAELAAQVVSQIKQSGGNAIAFCADVSNEAEVQKMIQKTIETFGKVDILVNNAGIDPRKAWNEITVEDWDHVMTTNVRSQFVCAKAVFPFMKQQDYGKIINVSSVVFLTGQKGYVHYVASKGAIIGFTRALANEIGMHHINVNAIILGAIKTENELGKLGSLEAQETATNILMDVQAIPQRIQTSDIEGSFLFLASADSDLITGQSINIDGGWMMH